MSTSQKTRKRITPPAETLAKRAKAKAAPSVRTSAKRRGAASSAKAVTAKGPIRRPNPHFTDHDADYDVDVELLRKFDTARLPLWKEAFMGVDWLLLRSSRVYYGCGIPHGDGAPVVLVPGFLASDMYLVELNLWLRRIGYRPYMSRIGRNADCPNVLVQHLVKTMRRAHNDTGKRVHLIGHSMGGVLSRIAAAFHPELTASVIALGSPIRGVRVHPWVLALRDVVHQKIQWGKFTKPVHLQPEHPACFTEACACGFACTWRGSFPEEIPQLALYTKDDGVVDWKICKTNRPEVDVEVGGTHCGLVWNPQVYAIIAERLADFSERDLRRDKKPRMKKAS